MSDTTPIRDVKTLGEALAGKSQELEAGKPAGVGDKPIDRREETSPELEALGVKQRFAIEDLMAGKSYAEAAYNAGVDRRTLYRWVNQDPVFRAAMDAWRRRAVASAEDQLTPATEAAVATLRMAACHDYRAAALLLKGRGLLSGAGPGRPRTTVVEPKELPILPERMGDFEVRLRELILSFREEEKPTTPENA
jgi:transposase-like protein